MDRLTAISQIDYPRVALTKNLCRQLFCNFHSLHLTLIQSLLGPER